MIMKYVDGSNFVLCIIYPKTLLLNLITLQVPKTSWLLLLLLNIFCLCRWLWFHVDYVWVLGIIGQDPSVSKSAYMLSTSFRLILLI